MKATTIELLQDLKTRLQKLRKNVQDLPTETVSRKGLQHDAENIATMWVEQIRSSLEYKFKLDHGLIRETSSLMKRLHVLSRPNNLKTSYLEVIKSILSKFDDKFILPLQQTSMNIEHILDLQKIIPSLPDPHESEYLQEAVKCASEGHFRAAIVMGWCCAIDRMQRKVLAEGFAKFNAASAALKSQTTGKFKRWNKEFSISTLSELQTIFDTDLIVVSEGMQLLDGNQAQRLETCFQYRNHSAHPGEAPVEEPHVIAFFTDINKIILQNPNFAV